MEYIFQEKEDENDPLRKELDKVMIWLSTI